MKENRLFAVMTVLAISASSVFGQFKIYNSELLKIGNVNEQAKITRGFEVSMPEVLMQAGNTGIRFAEGKVRIGNGVGTGLVTSGFEVSMPSIRMGTSNVGLYSTASKIQIGRLATTASFKTSIELQPEKIRLGINAATLDLAYEEDLQYVPKSIIVGGGGNFEEGRVEIGDILRLSSSGRRLMLGSANNQWVGVYSTRYYSTSATGISSLSDARYKTNVRPMESATAKVMEMRPVRFDYADIDSSGNKVADSLRSNRVGFIAQELVEVCPEAVDYDHYGDFYTVDYSVLIPFLVKAVQEQQAEIEALKEALKSKEE